MNPRSSALAPALTVMLFGLLCGAVCSCSSTERTATENNVSPYDPEFDPDPETVSAAESDLPEDQLLERAKSAYDSGLYSVARENWTKLREQYPSSYYATLSELKIADTYFFAGDYPAAVTNYEEFLKLHPAHDASPYVIYQIGNSFREQYSGIKHDQSPLVSAIKHYKRLVSEHPRSEYAVSARRAIGTCRELMAEHEASIARFYGKQGYDLAEMKRMRDLIDEYPETQAAAWARNTLDGIDESGSMIPKRAAPAKGGVAPGKPQLIIAGNVVDDSVLATRARMNKLEIVEDDISSTAKPAAPAETNPTPLLYVNCIEQDGLLIFSANFREPMAVDVPENASARRALLFPKSSSLSEHASKASALKACELNGVSLHFFAAKGDEKTLIAELEGAPDKIAHFFSLDRPNRLVVVVEN